MIWNEVWRHLEAVFAEVAADVKAEAPSVAWVSGRTAAQAFPFGAYLSFGLEGDASREDVVVSIDCKDNGDGLLLTCDVARGDGYVLADGPKVIVAKSGAESDAGLQNWLQEISVFLGKQVDLMKGELLQSQ